MNIRNLGIVFRKELLDIVRDRRTLMFMTVLPVVLVPVLLWVMSSFVESGVKRLRQESSTVAVINREQSPSLVALLERLERAKDDPSLVVSLDDPLLVGAMLQLVTPEELEEQMLVAKASRSEVKDNLGKVRFLTAINFEPVTDAGKTLMDQEKSDLLADGEKLRLVGSARRLVEDGIVPGSREADPVASASLKDQSALIADRERLARMSVADLAAVTEQLAELEILKEELSLAIEARRYDAILVLHEGFGDSLEGDGTGRYSVLFDESLDRSRSAQRKLVGFLDLLGTGIARQRVVDRGLNSTTLSPLRASLVNLGRQRSPLIGMLPYFMILMCLLGAIYPATDLGAGEKERGTLETLLVTPASRAELVLGKFLVITLAAVIAALLNVVSLTVTVQLGMLEIMGGGLTLDMQAIAASVLLIFPVAALFSAVLLAISVYAKSFKEAQSYAAPLQFVVIIPALVSLMPGVELSASLALIPLVNASLALKEAWMGIPHWDLILVILASSTVYAAAALVFCVRWFQREEVLFRT